MIECSEEPSDIVKRLEKLNKWQEEQKRMLFERQSNQRKLLGLEHKKMCEMLGIDHSDDSSDNLPETVEHAKDKTSQNDNTLGLAVLDQTKDGENGEVEEKKEPTKAAMNVEIKRNFLRRKQGLINRFNMDPDQFRLSKLPKYRFQSNHPAVRNKYPKAKEQSKENKKKASPKASKGVLKLITADEPKKTSYMDMMEEKFQEALRCSKNVCNSTPDVKSQQSSVNETPEPISWGAILDPQNIKPVEIPTSKTSINETLEESENLTIFQILEQQAQNGSIDLNSTCLKKFLKKSQKESIDEDQMQSIPRTLPPISREIFKNKNFNVSSSSESESEIEESHEKTNRVRFADTPPVETTVETLSQTLNSTDASQLFEEFKKQIFASQNDTTLTVNETSSALMKDLQQKAELIKTRLRELESEIASFKTNNMELIKSKQEHELEKAHFEQERQEAQEKLDDERIQMEIYFHDERMKIEEERKKMEKQIRTQKTLASSKEKKEISKLRDEIETLQKEMKKKDENHVAVQARLRAHVRNLEKDIRVLNGEIETLTKENKKLEAEKLKLERQTNNKMLHEINRNINKLASKCPSQTAVTQPVAVKPTSVPKEVKAKLPRQSKNTDVSKKSSLVKQQTRSLHSQSSHSFSSDDDANDEHNSNNASLDESDEQERKSPGEQGRKISTGESETQESSKPPCDSTFKREIRNPDGSTDILYPNGNLKKISPDGMIIRMLYFNKDIKETNINEGTVKYYYAETNTWHTSYIDGLEILEFPNGQTEHRHKDGRIEVHFPNSTIKISDPSDGVKLEEWRFADGSTLVQMRNGDRVLLMPNGQKEIHTTLSKRREYPDGTVKLVYPDGSQETRYSNGRVRLKDKDGNLLMDTESRNC